MIGMRPGNGGCAACGAKLQRLDFGRRWGDDRSVLLLCHGCGIVVGRGNEAAEAINAEVAAGRARRIDAAPGFVAMRLGGGIEA